MIGEIWFTFLYQPLFNALIWVYVNIAGQNLGWAVVWLTIFLRIILLPLSIISELTAARRQKAIEEAKKAMASYKNDRVAQMQAAREVMKKYHISPWAKVLTLAIQFLVLVLLYQVFLQGITGDRVIKTLYPSVDYPGRINILFFGFDIGTPHTLFWAGLAATYLVVSTLISNRDEKWDKSDLYFIIFFPLFTFAALWYLPMVKSLFILTTLIFSDIIKLVKSMLVSKKPAPAAAHH